MKRVCGYTFMTPKELIDFMFEKKIRELDFTLDEDMEAISEGEEPTAWYGIKLFNLFDDSEFADVMLLGYYGDGTDRADLLNGWDANGREIETEEDAKRFAIYNIENYTFAEACDGRMLCVDYDIDE